MGRTHPTYCEHGRVIASGDFLDTEHCPDCPHHHVTSDEGTSYCPLAEATAEENARLREALEQIATHWPGKYTGYCMGCDEVRWPCDTVLDTIRPWIDAVDAEDCEHDSASGVDQTPPDDPSKIWLCHQCGAEFATPLSVSIATPEEG